MILHVLICWGMIETLEQSHKILEDMSMYIYSIGIIHNTHNTWQNLNMFSVEKVKRSEQY